MQTKKKQDAVDFPYRHTEAVRLLAEGLERAKARGVSLRAVAKEMRYAEPVSISHMATGRSAVPIDRAHEIASVLKLDADLFMVAALEQRLPEFDWAAIRLLMTAERELAVFRVVTGRALSDMTDEQLAIISNVANADDPERRWIKPLEVPLVEAVRKADPSSSSLGLDSNTLSAIAAVVAEAQPRQPGLF
ncbi:hypothetical protein Q4F19_16205 [Sphingomonas sp. BIUV-7]|uniref:HTH cro/C1-type domain-containing protein n=1 Tax=Sphingomonas natans TaxID=3063330 RepID=A0ABT8YE52_9SPHN|nr:hypothetical protein [Sphingomonas sp. BIUV-7]MDO6415934.1 hypothetical protein [Sphingomonas sp. BIUV-7]